MHIIAQIVSFFISLLPIIPFPGNEMPPIVIHHHPIVGMQLNSVPVIKKISHQPVGANPIITKKIATEYAEIDGNGIVQQVIEADSSFFDRMGGIPNNWIPSNVIQNTVSKGYFYDSKNKVFIAPKPRTDAILVNFKWIIPFVPATDDFSASTTP